MKRNWTEGEIKVLKEKKSEGLDYKQIQKFLPHRSLSSLETKAGKLGLTKASPNPWTKEEEKILRKRSKEPISNRDLVKFLHGRSWKAIEARIKMLGINRRKQQKLAKTKRSTQMLLKRLREIEKKFNLELDLSNFQNKQSPIPYKCSKGHSDIRKYQFFYDSFHGCYVCGIRAQNKNKRLSKEQIIEKADTLNLEVEMSEVYENSRQPINAICILCGRKYETNAQRIMASMGCRPCGLKRGGKKNALKIKDIEERLQKLGIELLSKSYSSSYSKLRVRYLDCGHEDESTWNDLRGGRACGVCRDLMQATDKDYIACAKKYKGEILKIPRTRSLQAKWQCEYGHVFKRSLRDIEQIKNFCTVCTQSWGEGVCRSILEHVFETQFQKIRVKEMKSMNGNPLEYDCYNESLKIALEHNGWQHYQIQENWGGDKFFKKQSKNDQIKENYAKENGITLIVIPQVGSLTPLDEVAKSIEKQLKESGLKIPSKLKGLKLDMLDIKSGRDYYIEKVFKCARDLDIEILEQIQYADEPIRVRCKNGHTTHKTPRSLTSGFKCKDCRMEEISKPVQLSDGRQFKSRKAAADALNVNKTTINKAVLNGTKVKGFTIKDLK